eukprot:scaffold6612_cov114-Isochrysis_galbana.AAC.4
MSSRLPVYPFCVLWLPQPQARRGRQDRPAEPYPARGPWFPARDDESIPRWHGRAHLLPARPSSTAMPEFPFCRCVSAAQRM